ncbi:MAG: hypothetical protein K6U00_01240 [Armatimonadetes bacterium]|nr:hypothetical protein [Armatimonadota bacterium]
MRIATFLLLAVTILTSASWSANMLKNGDFETGDLAGTLPPWWGPDLTEKYFMHRAPGWIEAGPDTVKGWVGDAPIPAQVFKADTPLYVINATYHPTGERCMKRITLAKAITPKDGYSFGWTISGQDANGPVWVTQVLRVTPGKYLMNASWDVLVLNQSSTEKEQTAGVFAINTDTGIGRLFTSGASFSKAVWNGDSKGRWISQSVKNQPFETKTGMLEVRLLCVEKSADIPADEFSCVAFDNVVLELVPASAK